MGATTRQTEPTMTLVRQGPDAPVVQFAGKWTLGQGPDVEAQLVVVREALRQNDCVAFDLSQVGGWDTSLPMAVMRVIEVGEAQGGTADVTSLPRNVGRLIALAQVVPEADVGPPDASTFISQQIAFLW